MVPDANDAGKSYVPGTLQLSASPPADIDKIRNWAVEAGEFPVGRAPARRHRQDQKLGRRGLATRALGLDRLRLEQERNGQTRGHGAQAERAGASQRALQNTTTIQGAHDASPVLLQ